MKKVLQIKNIFLQVLQSIDQKAQKECESTGGLVAYHKQVWIVILVVIISLLANHYLKLNSSFYQFIFLLEELFSVDNHSWYHSVRTHTFSDLFSHIWWAISHTLFFLMIPILVIRNVLKDSLAHYGWQIGETRKYWKFYMSVVIFFVLFVAFGSSNESFSRYYPFYTQASRSWFDLLVWEVLYMSQFVVAEFFFRGFLLQGLRIPFGSLSIAIMTIPYMMIHLPKLWLEASGSIFFGIFLGILALHSRSIWGGVSIHVSVAFTLDIAVLLQTKGLPNVWFP